MTMNQKIIWGTASFLLLLFAAKRAQAKAVHGDVELGIPNVTGSGAEDLGNEGYFAKPQETEMERLIRISNELGGDTVARDGFVGLAAPE